MNREEKFIEYLSSLRNEGNSELLESITSGFKTLVEYRVGGSPAEKCVDIMESEDDIIDDTIADDISLEDPESLEESAIIEKERSGLVEDESGSDETRNTSEIEELLGIEQLLEVGEGSIKGKITPEILRSINNAVQAEVKKKAELIKNIPASDVRRIDYMNTVRANKWRDELLARNLDPEVAKSQGLAVNGVLESLLESLLESDDIFLGKVYNLLENLDYLSTPVLENYDNVQY